MLGEKFPQAQFAILGVLPLLIAAVVTYRHLHQPGGAEPAERKAGGRASGLA